jgi:hypothetical protein
MSGDIKQGELMIAALALAAVLSGNPAHHVVMSTSSYAQHTPFSRESPDGNFLTDQPVVSFSRIDNVEIILDHPHGRGSFASAP